MTPRPFIDILREHKRGETIDKLTGLLHDLTAGVAEVNKKGELNIKVTLKPAGEQGAFTLMIEPTLKLPAREARNIAAPATFSISPTRFAGITLLISSLRSRAVVFKSVGKSPGEIVLT